MSAIATTLELARELGFASDTPVVLADRSNLVLHLVPHPLVARVAMATSISQIGTRWIAREVSIARSLDRRGAIVTRPAKLVDPGPYERAGWVVSLWELEPGVIEGNQGELDPSEVGSRLARAHALLREGHAAREFELPELGGWHEARAVLERVRSRGFFNGEELSTIEHAWDRGERVISDARAHSASWQPVHGDAHSGNVIVSARGAVWTDWEDAFLGPIEWDLSCLRSRAELFGENVEATEAMCASYDQPWNRELARDLGLCRNLQAIVWLAMFSERQPEIEPRVRARYAKMVALQLGR